MKDNYLLMIIVGTLLGHKLSEFTDWLWKRWRERKNGTDK